MLRTLLSAGMLLLELGQVVDIVIDNDVEVVGLVVRRNVVGCEGFRHVACVVEQVVKELYSRVERSRNRRSGRHRAYKCLGSRSLTRDQADM